LVLEWHNSKGRVFQSKDSYPGGWKKWSQIVVLAPHSDDAALSIPAFLTYLTGKGLQTVIVTCFSVSDFAPFAGSSIVSDITEIRKSEDDRYTSMLGPRCRTVWLDFSDAPLRGYRLPDLLRLRDLTGVERDVAKQIECRVSPFLAPQCGIFVPLGLGDHVDHRITCEAGASISRAIRSDIIFYEDMPYTLSLDEPTIYSRIKALEKLLGGRLRSIRCFGSMVLAIKAAAAYCYPSQFRRDDIETLIQRELGQVRCKSERVWQLHHAKE
jgi:hypothetical protein